MFSCQRGFNFSSLARPSVLSGSWLLAVLVSSCLTGCITKGDTNVGTKEDVKATEPKDEEDAGGCGPRDCPTANSEADDDTGPANIDATDDGTDEDGEAGTDDENPEPSTTHPADDTEPPTDSESSDDEETSAPGLMDASTDDDSEPQETTDDDSDTTVSAGPDAGEVPADVTCTGEDIPISVSAGYDSTCGITSNGTVKCWGANTYGQLGNTGSSSTIPVVVPGLCARQVELGDYHACAIDLEGGVHCWGYNEQSQLGNGSTSNRSRPTSIELAGVQQLAAGSGHTCALMEGGSVKCWGSNAFGEVGNAGSTTELFDQPQDVLGLDDVTVVQLTAGLGFTCALLDSGSARCWGYGGYGQLGNGQTQANALLPVDVLELEDATQLAAGSYQVCARLDGDSVRCWGEQYLGAASGPPDRPAEIAGLFAAGVAAGGTVTCAVNTDSGVHCWGLNDRGQLGYPTIQMQQRYAPEPIGEVSEGASVVTLGHEHGCMVLSEEVRCWGRGDSGQLGNSANADSDTPVKVQLFL